MKKLLAIILSLIMLFSFVGCGERDYDSQEVKKAGKLLVGVTQFAPMNYIENGEWTGFDTEFARLFAKEKLGVEVEFVEIVWDEKFKVLEDCTVDCIWNGMTNSEEANKKASVSDAYLRNAQMLVTKAELAGNYKDGYDIRNLKLAVEKGSAAEECLVRTGYKDVAFKQTQIAAVESVINGQADGAVVDVTLVNAMIGEGKKYPQLAKVFDFSGEVYSVAFRQGSDLTEMLNDFIDEIRDEELLQLANKYGLTLA